MRTIIIVLLGTILCYSAEAQSCGEYFPIEEGSKWVMETFNHKNKFQTRSIQSVTDKSEVDGGFEATMTGEITNEKEKEVGVIDYTVKCQDDRFLISMNSFLNPEQMSAYEDMDVEIDGDYLELPSSLEAGMELNDASVEVRVNNSGFPIMTMNIDIYDRKVEGFESVTTPAGTFECVKIVYKARSQMGKTIPIKVNFSGAEWFAKNTGVVRTESYDKKDNLSSYTVLTEYSK